MSQDLNDSQYIVGSTPQVDAAEHLNFVVEDGGITPIVLNNASGPTDTEGEMLVIGKITGAAINGGAPNLGDLEVLAQGQVPFNQGSATSWTVTLQGNIRQTPPA